MERSKRLSIGQAVLLLGRKLMRLTKAMKEALRVMQSAGGKARAKALSPERRRQIARQGALARLRNVELRARAQEQEELSAAQEMNHV
jgi:hypothetical protein